MHASMPRPVTMRTPETQPSPCTPLMNSSLASLLCQQLVGAVAAAGRCTRGRVTHCIARSRPPSTENSWLSGGCCQGVLDTRAHSALCPSLSLSLTHPPSLPRGGGREEIPGLQWRAGGRASSRPLHGSLHAPFSLPRSRAPYLSRATVDGVSEARCPYWAAAADGSPRWVRCRFAVRRMPRPGWRKVCRGVETGEEKSRVKGEEGHENLGGGGQQRTGEQKGEKRTARNKGREERKKGRGTT